MNKFASLNPCICVECYFSPDLFHFLLFLQKRNKSVSPSRTHDLAKKASGGGGMEVKAFQKLMSSKGCDS